MTAIKPVTILGIDPGYDRMGWAVGTAQAQNWSHLFHGCIETSKDLPLIERYRIINRELKEIIQQHRPSVAVIESLFFFKNQKTALKVSEARGVIINTCLNQNLKIAEFTPLQIKQAVTGYGRADKASVDKMVRLQLKLTDQKIIDDAMDALAVMMTYQTQMKLLKAQAVA
ncbi:MAG: crossover junction endodeoxyribonuclease RuvC [Candidatus Paceibacterota bacterium]